MTTRPTGQPVRRRAPAKAWLATAATTAVGAGLVGLVAAVLSDQPFWLTFGVFAACTAWTFGALGWVLFVTPHTVETPEHADDNVEVRWVEKAGLGAFQDVLVVGGIGTFLLAVAPIYIQAYLALLGVVLVAMAGFAFRYARLRRREA